MNNNNSSPSIGKRIGEFLILALYLAVDAFEIWHRSHLGALFAAFVGVVALLLLDGRFSRRKIIVFAGTVAAACLAIYFVVPAEPAPPEIEVVGTLRPGNDGSVPDRCAAATDPEAWRLLIGTSAAQFVGPIDYPLLVVGNCPVLTINRDATGISVTADLFDDTGHLVASIKNNEFHALSGATSKIERDHDLSKLIVMAEGSREILFVHYMNKSTVRVRGVFGCPGHATIEVKDNAPLPGVYMAPGVCINVTRGARFTKGFFVVK
jgi:hypothetical protein